MRYSVYFQVVPNDPVFNALTIYQEPPSSFTLQLTILETPFGIIYYTPIAESLITILFPSSLMFPPPNPHPPSADGDPGLALLEQSILTLQELGKRKPLEGEEKRQSEEAARTIREHGFTDKESGDLSNGSFAPATIKEKARGAKVKDRSTMDKAVQLMAQMVALGLSFQDVKDSIHIKTILVQKKVELQEIAMLISQAKDSGIELQSVISDHKQMKQHGIPMPQLKEVLSYKQQLDELGITIANGGSLEQIALAARTHGGEASKIVEAINKLGGLPAIENKVDELQSTIEAKQGRISELDGEITAKQSRCTELEVSLNRYDRIAKLGFDEQSFDQIFKIATAGGKVNRSAREVVEGLAKYSSFLDLERDMSDLNRKMSDAELAVKQFESEHAHMQTLLEMCDTLLYKYKFSVPAIRELVKIAESYGKPMDVFDALAKYGNIQALEGEIERLEKSRVQLGIKVAEIEQRTGELSAKADSIGEFITASINPINEEFKKAAANLETTYHTQMTLLKAEAAKYGNMLGQIKYWEEGLKLARFLHLVIKVPSEVSAFPFDYALFLLDGVDNLCLAKGVNPNIDLARALSDLGVRQLDSVPVTTVIELVKRTLRQHTGVA